MLTEMVRQLTVDNQEISSLAERFAAEMKRGLAGDRSSLKMLPSYIDRPAPGQKLTGEFVAVDFGGTNVRILLVGLSGPGEVEIVAKKIFPLRDEGGKDYTSATASANELFGYIARQIASIIRPDRLYDMGHTFSFPCRQLAVDSARLITWTKEIRTAGVEGEDVGGIFARAMVDAGVNNVKQVAIINDTVGTLLAASHNFDNVDIGSICGTGHNTCYRELNPPMAGQPMIINMESGNFDKIRRTSWDEQLDRQSDLPGQQRLEKMCSGHYIGRLTGIVFADYLNKVGRLPLTGGEACARLCPDGADLSRIISDATPAADCSRATIADCWGESAARRLETEDYRALRAIAAAIKTRSARLVAATYLGTLQHIDPQFCQPHTIAIDGSLYEKLSGYVGDLRRAVDDNLPDGARPVRLILAKDGSGIGAAVAAAVAGVTRQAQ